MNTDIGEPTTKRELAKAERRSRIVEAATNLLREVGYDSISMSQIAETAGVSPKTLYNLFASKASIFGHVFEQDLSQFRILVEKRSDGSGLERLFVAIKMASRAFQQDPNFYRAMARIIDSENDGMKSAIVLPRNSFWCSQVKSAATKGAFQAGTDIELLSASVTNLITGTFLDWAAGRISAPRFARICTFGISSLLMPHATQATSSIIQSHMNPGDGND